MKKAILATKVGMTQIFDENGVLVPVTVLQAGPCVVTQVKTADNDGYSAIQVGFGEKKENRVNKPMKGQFAKAGVSCKRYLKEFRFEDAETYTLGQEIKADIFGAGDTKSTLLQQAKVRSPRVPSRHGRPGDPWSWFQISSRAGSQWCLLDPSKVFKGKNARTDGRKVENHRTEPEIVKIDTENNLLLVKGAVPGPNHSYHRKETVKMEISSLKGGTHVVANVSVLNMEGKEVGSMELNDAVFGVEINEHLVHQAVVLQLANNRQGTQKAKTRSEVSGGGRKPWRQKGTGHARQGSTRAPQWTGGGVVFAPVPRDYSFKMNKKEKRAALKSVLTSKVQENKFIVQNLNKKERKDW